MQPHAPEPVTDADLGARHANSRNTFATEALRIRTCPTTTPSGQRSPNSDPLRTARTAASGQAGPLNRMRTHPIASGRRSHARAKPATFKAVGSSIDRCTQSRERFSRDTAGGSSPPSHTDAWQICQVPAPAAAISRPASTAVFRSPAAATPQSTRPLAGQHTPHGPASGLSGACSQPPGASRKREIQTPYRTSTGRRRSTNSNKHQPTTLINNHEPAGRAASPDKTNRSSVASAYAIDLEGGSVGIFVGRTVNCPASFRLSAHHRTGRAC